MYEKMKGWMECGEAYVRILMHGDAFVQLNEKVKANLDVIYDQGPIEACGVLVATVIDGKGLTLTQSALSEKRRRDSLAIISAPIV